MAVRALSALQTSSGSSAEFQSLLGIELYRKGQPAASLDAFSAMLRFRQPNADELRFVGLDYVALHDLASAEHWLRESAKRNPGDWRTWRYLGGVQYSEELAAQAEQSFRTCLRIDPDNTLAEDGLARSLDAEGDLTEAATHYASANRLNIQSAPPSSLPPLHLGSFLLRQGNANEAVEPLQSAERIGPADPEVHELLAQAFNQAGRLDDAIREMRRASILLPQSARLHFLLSQLYRRATRIADEEAELKQYHALSKEFPNDPDR